MNLMVVLGLRWCIVQYYKLHSQRGRRGDEVKLQPDNSVSDLLYSKASVLRKIAE